ncbi:hypothetical protein NDU88_003713 [Pleurodeles waltl]|uniref:Uncharacterized protein n=1 Tax=Pleurodeles waltl TaxID=8319 RepID=A0AAV7W358_PLEWA|nr:hypothetical protein NDU88_003713 [Pleurodeles waltl]
MRPFPVPHVKGRGKDPGPPPLSGSHLQLQAAVRPQPAVPRAGTPPVWITADHGKVSEGGQQCPSPGAPLEDLSFTSGSHRLSLPGRSSIVSHETGGTGSAPTSPASHQAPGRGTDYRLQPKGPQHHSPLYRRTWHRPQLRWVTLLIRAHPRRCSGSPSAATKAHPWPTSILEAACRQPAPAVGSPQKASLLAVTPHSLTCGSPSWGKIGTGTAGLVKADDGWVRSTLRVRPPS